VIFGTGSYELYFERGNERRPGMRGFFVVARGVLAAAIALATVAAVFNIFAAVAARSQKCPGHEMVVGESVVLSLLGALLVWMAWKFAQGTDERLRQLFEIYNVPVKLIFGLVVTTFGTVVAYATLFATLAMAGLVTGISVTRYDAVAAHCLATMPNADRK
jgi:hypothetical protein